MRKRLAAVSIALVLAVPSLPAQAPGRIATTPQALMAVAVFYHGRQIAVRGNMVTTDGLTRLDPGSAAPATDAPAGSRAIYVYWKERPTRTDGEIRGEFWDLGRLREDDARFAMYDFKPVLEAGNRGQWPGRDQLFVILNAVFVESPLPPSPTLRALALAPSHYENRGVTVSGRFRGRNLLGDLPAPLNKSKWDFVLQSADAAIWVSGLRPRGKGFDLDPGARVDTGRWLEVTGVVRTEGSRAWIEAKSVQLSSEPEDTPIEIAVPATPKEPPPEVVFSAPVASETDVETATRVRVQFSRDMDGRTFRDRVRVSYIGKARGQQPAAPAFAAVYNDANRAVEIRFVQPLERFQTVKVELLEGITAVDGQPLQPWSLTFSTGG